MDNYSSITKEYIKNMEKKLRELGVEPSLLHPYNTKNAIICDKLMTRDELAEMTLKLFSSKRRK